MKCTGEVAICRLILPDGNSRREKATVTPGPDFPQKHSWEVECLQPGQKDFVMEVLVGEKVFSRSAINQVVMPARKVEKQAYIPTADAIVTAC